MAKIKCPKCGSKKIELHQYNDKQEAALWGCLTGVGSGAAAAGVVSVGAIGKLALGAKIVGIIAAASGPIGAAIAIPTAAVVGGGLAAAKAYSKTKECHKCRKCGYCF